MSQVNKIFKTFVPYILIVGTVVLLALISQVYAEVKEDPAEVHFVSSSK
jgi:hypothetical protein